MGKTRHQKNVLYYIAALDVSAGVRAGKKMLPRRRHSIQTVTDDSSKYPSKTLAASGGIEASLNEDDQKPSRVVTRRPSLVESIQYMSKSVSK